MNQCVALEFLKRIGFEADVADNGQEACDAVQSGNYNIIFMDMHMPVMDGIDATKQIRSEKPSRVNPYIIALTASALIGDREKCLQAGMNDYITKPLKPKDLQNALVTALNVLGINYETSGFEEHTVTQKLDPVIFSEDVEPNEADEEIEIDIDELIDSVSDEIDPECVLDVSEPEVFDVSSIEDKESIDFSVLEIFAESVSGGVEVLEELVGLYFQSMDENLVKIKAAYKKKESMDVSKVAHAIKGSSSNLGVNSIFEMAKELESRCYEGNITNAGERIDQIEEEYFKVKVELKRFLNSKV